MFENFKTVVTDDQTFSDDDVINFFAILIKDCPEDKSTISASLDLVKNHRLSSVHYLCKSRLRAKEFAKSVVAEMVEVESHFTSRDSAQSK